MKPVFLIIAISTLTAGYAQDGQQSLMIPGLVKDSSLTQIQLSDTLNESRLGVWTNGNYMICADLTYLTEWLHKEHAGLVDALEHQYKDDTLAAERCRLYAERYLKALTQLQSAEHGFDLRQLVLYIGPDNPEQNKGNSATVETFIRQMTERGETVVYYKEKRIYTLQKQVEWDSIMSVVWMFYENKSDAAFQFVGHLNW